MNQLFGIGVAQQSQRQPVLEVSESAFEYLLGELLLMKSIKNDNEQLKNSTDVEFSVCQRLDETGYSIGYRYI